MSEPGTPSESISQADSFSGTDTTNNNNSNNTPSESQISFKKHQKIKNEINSQRRQALKQFYKLQKQQEQLQSNPLPQTTLPNTASHSHTTHSDKDTTTTTTQDSDDELEEEIRSGKPLADIDLQTSQFKDILKHVNKLSSSVNLINSDIKNIIYNNYYELIKLNDFLKDMSEGKAMEGVRVDSVSGGNGGLLEMLKGLNKSAIENGSSVTKTSSTLQVTDLSNLDQLQSLMDSIKTFNEKETTAATRNLEEEQELTTSLNLMRLKSQTTTNDDDDQEIKSYQSKVDESITNTLKDLQAKDQGKETLIRQLQEIKDKIGKSEQLNVCKGKEKTRNIKLNCAY
ncbi:hypothetical protein WICPIJ_008388 [Wickerhamomyces pijperi]|uniref:Vacuolar protein sorting-associated protein 51 homolog n=1 Tax=Wickerhamomyces pijperi TaxID=599730 RepID=A0A9P8TIP6_WICPI|nr:hypothetical protein WICPIJ_008388 [Wickerhamomyces pijperi]